MRAAEVWATLQIHGFLGSCKKYYLYPAYFQKGKVVYRIWIWSVYPAIRWKLMGKISCGVTQAGGKQDEAGVQVVPRDRLTFSDSWPQRRPRCKRNIWPIILESSEALPSIFLFLCVVLLFCANISLVSLLSCSFFPLYPLFHWLLSCGPSFAYLTGALSWTIMWHQCLNVLFLLCQLFLFLKLI